MSLSMINEIRDALRAAASAHEEVPQPVEEWFVDNPSHKNHISYVSIAHQADSAYEKWLTLDPRINFNATMKTKLIEWISSVSDEELKERLEETFDGVDADSRNQAFKFTKFQRLSLSTWLHLPFDIEAVANVNVEALRSMAEYTVHETSRRNIPLHSNFAMLKGSCPDVTIVDTPTAGGKTAWAMAAAMLLLSPYRFEKLKDKFYMNRMGSIFQGTCELKIARLCIVAAGGNTFNHFKETLARLIPVAERKYPGQRIIMWDKLGKNTTQKAYDLCLDGRTILFWLIPVSETNKVLRSNPDVTVSCVVTDEYTIDTPRERSSTTKSPVCHNLITQATPQALVHATSGHRSWLKDLFGGTLHAPRSVARLLKRRSWTEAQLALDQACKLNLITLTTFRPLIRDDLRPLVPNGMDVHFVRCRILTAAAHITNSQVDVVPADFPAVLLNYLRNVRLTDDSILSIRRISSGYFSIEQITALIRSITSRDVGVNVLQHPSVIRLIERINELSSQCPICWQSDACISNGLKIFGCCGYCVCGSCFNTVSRCPFCRSDIPESFRRSDVPEVVSRTTEVIDLVENDDETHYPPRPAFFPGSNLDNDITRLTHANARQVDNVVNVLHILFQYNYHRVVIILEKNATQVLSSQLDNYFNAFAIGRLTGFNIVRVDHSFSGKGSQFTKIKQDFDDLTKPPMALLCYGVDPSFLYGTDLGRANAVVSVGDIDSKILTQAIGRTIRPVQGRDPTQPVKMIKIYSGNHNLRRRARDWTDDWDSYMDL